MMAKHVWEWDKKSHNPMMVVCTRCGQRIPLAKVIDEVGCNGCPDKAAQEVIQEELFRDEPKD